VPDAAVSGLTGIVLPKDYDSVAALTDLESINSFAVKSNSVLSDDRADDESPEITVNTNCCQMLTHNYFRVIVLSI
jgi:hypothetical protein